jgi:hypothetical protein
VYGLKIFKWCFLGFSAISLFACIPLVSVFAYYIQVTKLY